MDQRMFLRRDHDGFCFIGQRASLVAGVHGPREDFTLTADGFGIVTWCAITIALRRMGYQI